MIRNFVRLLILVLVIVVFRSLIGMITRAVSQAMTPRSPKEQSARSAGELKKDPVCGTFVPVVSSVTKEVDGKLVHFCSVACRDKFRVA
jgi:uncharacterized protein